MRTFFKPQTMDESDDSFDIENDDVDNISSDSDDQFDNFEDSDEDDETELEAEDEAGASGMTKPLNDLNEDEEEDETVRAIIAAIKKPRSVPPEILTDDYVTDISFHPHRDIIAIATILGDILLYKYSNEENTLIKSIEVHTKACRDIEFSTDGNLLLSGSKDKSIMLTDMETEKLRKFYDNAHDDTINKLYVIDENTFSSGDDSGMVKLWDQRTDEPIFALKEVEDYISCMLTNEAQKLLLVTSGDGYLTTINIGSRKLFVQSEPYSEELTCMGLYRGDSKLVVGTSKGRVYTYNWGEFGYHCDMFPGLKSPISRMIPVTDRIGCMGGEDGIIRATHIAPFRNLGVVGQHSLPVESMDINHSGGLIASCSHNNDIRFWNIKYFEDFQDIKYNEKHNSYRERQHNLPSSKYSNTNDFFADLVKGDDD